MSQRGRPFEPGNKFGKGRPKGSPNKKSLLWQQMLLDRGGRILTTVMDRAEAGDPTAMKLCMDRLISPLKHVSELPIERSEQGPQVIEIRLIDDDPKDSVKNGEAENASPPQLAAVSCTNH